MLLDGQAEAFALELGRAGYYTAPPEVYARGVRLLAAEYTRTLPQDTPAPAAPTRPVEVAVSLAATVPAPEPQTPHVEAPTAPSEPASPAPPPVAPVTLPRIGEPLAEAPRPWWLRLLVWLGRVLVRRPLP